jgi:anti-anti-sigma regulatory factor
MTYQDNCHVDGAGTFIALLRAMLKVIDTTLTDGSRVLRLEGRVVGRWVEEVRRAAGESADLVIDLRDVSFLDAQGIELVLELAHAGARIVNGSPFVNEQLNTANSD